jgi:folate-binding protein YgfZ
VENLVPFSNIFTGSMAGPSAHLRGRSTRLTFQVDIWQISFMKAALLPDRGVVKLAGPDARKFLNGLVTADLGKVTTTHPGFTALLTPQGKVIVDFIVIGDDEGFFLDCPRALATALVERLGFYKLRAKVMIEDVSDVAVVMAIWDGAAAARWGVDYPDPRLPELGRRCISPPQSADAAAAYGAELVDAAAYEAHRIALGVPAGGLDFAYGDAFPHEADMDQLNGVDFQKGCFIGQEVVSRMEHRGTARSRVVPVALGADALGGDAGAPASGSAVTADGKPMGVMGSVAGRHGLALLRLDRVDEALAGGASLQAGGVALKLVKPAWARFAFPGETARNSQVVQ